jgi:hypothetical protein
MSLFQSYFAVGGHCEYPLYQRLKYFIEMRWTAPQTCIRIFLNSVGVAYWLREAACPMCDVATGN